MISWSNTVVSPTTGITLNAFQLSDIHLDFDSGKAIATVRGYVDLNKDYVEDIEIEVPIASLTFNMGNLAVFRAAGNI